MLTKYAVRLAVLLTLVWTTAPATSAERQQKQRQSAQEQPEQQRRLLQELDTAVQAALNFRYGQSSAALQKIEEIVFHLSPDSPLRSQVEQRLIAGLEKSTTNDARAFFCRQLRVVGTERCVPALEKLLTDPQLSHMARYALERMPGETVTAAFRRALPKTSGRVQAGIIESLGNRHDQRSVPALAELLESDELVVARAAAVALARIGACEPLLARLQTAEGRRAVELQNAVLQCAETLALAGQTARAEKIYQAFYQRSDSERLHFAGLRGLVSIGGAKATQLLTKTIRSGNAKERRFAIALVGQLAGCGDTQQLAGVVEQLEPEEQVLLVRALGVRGDPAAEPALAKAATADNEPLRLAAIEALGSVGGAQTVPLLLRLAAHGTEQQRLVARASLRHLKGDRVDAVLVEQLSRAQPAVRVEVLHALAERRAAEAVEPVLQAATDPEPSVRAEALRTLGALARSEHLPALTQLALTRTEPAELDMVLQTIGRVFLRASDREQSCAPVLAALEKAPKSKRPALIRALGKSGAESARRAIREALHSGQPDLVSAAVQALVDWPDERVAGDLIDAVALAPTPELKDLAVRGYLALAARSTNPTQRYRQAIESLERLEDKKRVLEQLGLTAERPEALAVALSLLDNPQLRANAGVAAVRIAWRVRRKDPKRASAALEKVLAKVQHPDVRRRAREVLDALDIYRDHILDWVGVGPFTEKGKDGRGVYETAFPPEQAPDSVRWKKITSGIGNWSINLEATFGSLDFCAAYLRTFVWSPTDQSVQLELGSDDGVKVWLNGKLLFDRWAEHAAEPRQVVVPARLKKGWNDLMLKVVDQRGGWQVGCRIRRPGGRRLTGLKVQSQRPAQ